MDLKCGIDKAATGIIEEHSEAVAALQGRQVDCAGRHDLSANADEEIGKIIVTKVGKQEA